MERFEEQGIAGYLHVPQTKPVAAIALTHGAGANCNAPLLLAVANRLEEAGFIVLRYDLPFRQKRPKGPPLGTGAADREGIREASKALRTRFGVPVVLGGHSYGGRQTTMIAAEDSTIADALFALSYPLHPPAKPAQLRTEHFPNLKVASLFVHGTKDAFGSPEEMQTALAMIPASHELQLLTGAGHDLRGGKFDIAAHLIDPLRTLAKL